MHSAPLVSLAALLLASLPATSLALRRWRRRNCACNLPLGTIEHSLITRYDAQVESKVVAARMTIGGDLITDSTDNKEADGLVTVGGLYRPHHAVQWVFKSNPNNWLPVFENFTGVFTWAEFKDLANNIVQGRYEGETNDDCDDYHVFVQESGGSFDTGSFHIDPKCQQQATGVGNGKSLVVFLTTDEITLNPTAEGNGFGPSVLAPFSTVTLSENASFMGGFLVAESAVILGSTSTLHGDFYKGPLDCACPTSSQSSSPTMSPATPEPLPSIVTSSPTVSPTMSPTIHSVSGEADPHLVNVRSERFDVMKPGKHTFLRLPRGSAENTEALLLQASVTARGDVCAGKLYITGLNISGSWLGSVGQLRLSTQGGMFNVTREVLGLAVGSSGKMSLVDFLATVPASMVNARHVEVAKEVQALNQHVTMLSLSFTFGPGVIMRVDWEHQKEKVGYSNWLKLSSWGLSRAEMSVGGLLGDDDHRSVMSLPEECLVTRGQSTLRGTERHLRNLSAPVSVAASASMDSPNLST